MHRDGLNSFSIGLVTLALLLLLASALGVWFEVLRLNTSVDTGELNVEFRDVIVVEGAEAEGKDIGNCIYAVGEHDGIEVLMVTIRNGYPGYGCTVFFDVVNVGTIPVIGPYTSVSEIPNDLGVNLNIPTITQLHPGEKSSFSISVEVLQSAGENHVYTIWISVTYVQWNEAYGSISGYVWNDTDNDGYWDDNESPVGDVQIRLISDQQVVATVFTNSSGYYRFMAQGGVYTISPLIPLGYVFTTSPTILVDLPIGGSSAFNNFGIRLSTNETPGLTVMGEFRKTDANLKNCPVYLGTPLDRDDEYHVIRAEVPKSGNHEGKVRSVEPGAFFNVIWLRGVGLKDLNISLGYDYQFNIHDGQTGKIRAYVLDLSNNCTIIELDNTLTYTVDNAENTATLNISLPGYLEENNALLLYVKFKPTRYSAEEPDGLIGNQWETLDKYFNITILASTNLGSIDATNTVKIIEK